MNIFDKFTKFWYFTFRNKVVWKGEKGGFRVKFRRFWVEAESLSGNWKARWTAAEFPYSYLLSAATGENEETVWGYVERMYMWSMVLLTSPELAKDMDAAFEAYQKRLEPQQVEENEEEEKEALEEVKEVQEYVETPRRRRRKQERGVDGRFRKAVKKEENHENQS